MGPINCAHQGGLDSPQQTKAVQSLARIQLNLVEDQLGEKEFKKRELLDLNTPWGRPSYQILKTSFNNKEVYFLPRHGRGHSISPSKINFRANIDALKQLGVTDIVSVSAVGSLKEDLPPGKFVIVDQFIDRTFSRIKTFFNDEIFMIVWLKKIYILTSSDIVM